MRTGEHKGPETVSGAEPALLSGLRDAGSLSPGVSSLGLREKETRTGDSERGPLFEEFYYKVEQRE